MRRSEQAAPPQSTNIGWTNATWNPVTGCSHVSPGCVNCYAEAIELRFGRSKKPWTAQNAAENVKLHTERLAQPLSWREPKRVFVNSMSDMFHDLVPDDFLDQCFAVMALAAQHTFQILTKRPERMLAYFRGLQSPGAEQRAFNVCAWADTLTGHGREVAPVIATLPAGLPNVWLGVSCENQRAADERIPLLLETPAAVRFISAEPLLGPVNLNLHYCAAAGRPIDWVIVGGESGPHHRPMAVAWAENIAAQCADAGVALFVKQDSGPRPGKQGRLSDALWSRKEYPVSHTPTPEPPK